MVPNDAMTLTNLSDALVHTNKAAEGPRPRDADRARLLARERLVNYGVSLAASGQIPQAIAAYRKTVELQPGHILALNNLGALGQSGQLAEARDLYRRLVVMAPNSVEAHMNWRSYLRLGDGTRPRASGVGPAPGPNAVQELDAIFREYQSDLPVLHPSRQPRLR
jgi:tetratricopeptide (TPR) repeat protein